MKTILVTGASGFVGTHLINELKNDYTVLGTYNTKSPHSQTNVLYKQLDLRGKQQVFETLSKTKPDAIIHLAAIAKTTEGRIDHLLNINFYATLNILDSIVELKKTDSYNPKMLYISSAEVYGKTINPEMITEDSPFFPANLYGVTKIAADRICYQYTQSHNLNISILRPFTHSGPGQALGFFVPDMASQIIKLEKEPINNNTIQVGNLEAIRDYLDVRDVTRAYKLALEKELPKGEAFNICSGKGTKMKIVLEKLLKLSSQKLLIEQDPSRMRPSDIPILVGDNQKFKKATGWKLQYSLDQMLKDSLEYWRHPD